MLDHIIEVLRQQFGDNFAGIIIIIVSVFAAIRYGVKEVQTWIKKEILDPYLAPTIAKVATHEHVQISHTELLIDHEKRLRNNERISQILQGKVLGGLVHIPDDEEEN